MQFKKLSPDTDWGPERACAQHSAKTNQLHCASLRDAQQSRNEV